MIKKTIEMVLLLLILAIVQPFPVYGEGISLEKAVEAGIRHDTLFKNRLLDRDRADIELEKSKKEKLFKVDFSGTYLFKSQLMELPFPAGSQGMKAGSRHNYDLMLRAVQPIWTGNIISNSIKMEELKAAAEIHHIRLRQWEVTAMIKGSYFSYRLLKSKKIATELLIEQLQLHLDRIKALYNEDLVRETDLLETQMKIEEARLNIDEVESKMIEESISFKRLSTIDIQKVREDYGETGQPLEQSMARFTAHHPALKTIDHNIQLLALRKKIVRAGDLPKVSSFAEVHYGKPGIDFFKNKWSVYFQGGIRINLNIFDWKRSKQDNRLLDASIEKLNNRRQDLLIEARKGLSQLYARINYLEKQLNRVKEMADLAARDAELKETLYKENQAANTDYLAAVLNKERYVSMQDQLKFQVQLLLVNINRLIGPDKDLL